MTMANRIGQAKTGHLDLAGFGITGLLFGFVLLAGCARAPVVKPSLPMTPTPRVETEPLHQPGAFEPDMESRLRTEAARWAGTPHRLGGNGPGGIDCSGLTQRIYGDLFHIRLPRTTRDLVRAGVAVDKDALLPGDLVFFRIPKKKLRHVGVYLGRWEFVHASTSKGVVISRLDNPYWRRAYWTARRIL
jgi:NlpC/P60 family